MDLYGFSSLASPSAFGLALFGVVERGHPDNHHPADFIFARTFDYFGVAADGGSIGMLRMRMADGDDAGGLLA